MLRSQPWNRVCTGEASGVGDSEGNEVKLFVSAAGEGVRPSEVVELRLDGRTRVVLLFLPMDVVDACDALRARSTGPADSVAAMSGAVREGRETLRDSVMASEGSASSIYFCQERGAAHVGHAASWAAAVTLISFCAWRSRNPMLFGRWL